MYLPLPPPPQPPPPLSSQPLPQARSRTGSQGEGAPSPSVTLQQPRQLAVSRRSRTSATRPQQRDRLPASRLRLPAVVAALASKGVHNCCQRVGDRARVVPGERAELQLHVLEQLALRLVCVPLEGHNSPPLLAVGRGQLQPSKLSASSRSYAFVLTGSPASSMNAWVAKY
eukprot:6172341-Pleurochrysis_carterae.AAC.1